MKNRFLCLIMIAGLLVLACSKEVGPVQQNPINQPDPDNQPPASFNVTVDTTGLDPVLIWTSATDPDGDPVAYSLFLEGQRLATGLSDTEFILEGLEYETNYEGRVLASDGNGGSSESGFSFTS